MERHLLKKLLILIFSALLLTACSDNNINASANAEPASASLNQLFVLSNGVCNASLLAQTLADGDNLSKQKFDVSLQDDKEANYSYYMIVAHGEFNADRIRHAVCGYITQYNCSIYWGNVVSIAMLAETKAPRFPGDTSPHYQLTPQMCQKILSKSKL